MWATSFMECLASYKTKFHYARPQSHKKHKNVNTFSNFPLLTAITGFLTLKIILKLQKNVKTGKQKKVLHDAIPFPCNNDSTVFHDVTVCRAIMIVLFFMMPRVCRAIMIKKSIFAICLLDLIRPKLGLIRPSLDIYL